MNVCKADTGTEDSSIKLLKMPFALFLLAKYSDFIPHVSHK